MTCNLCTAHTPILACIRRYKAGKVHAWFIVWLRVVRFYLRDAWEGGLLFFNKFKGRQWIRDKCVCFFLSGVAGISRARSEKKWETWCFMWFNYFALLMNIYSASNHHSIDSQTVDLTSNSNKIFNPFAFFLGQLTPNRFFHDFRLKITRFSQ